MWGMGDITGPMFTGGDAACSKGHYEGLESYPRDEEEYRAIILRAEHCKDYLIDKGTDFATVSSG